MIGDDDPEPWDGEAGGPFSSLPGWTGVLVGPAAVLGFAWILVDVPCPSVVARAADALLLSARGGVVLGILGTVGASRVSNPDHVANRAGDYEGSSPLDSQMVIPLVLFGSAVAFYAVGKLLAATAVSDACAAGVGVY